MSEPSYIRNWRLQAMARWYQHRQCKLMAQVAELEQDADAATSYREMAEDYKRRSQNYRELIRQAQGEGQ